MFERLSRKLIYKSQWIDLFLDSIKLDGVIIKDYHVIHYKKKSVVILIKKENTFLFVKALRYITNSVEVELPAGNIESEESIVDAATREVFEETGVVTKNEKILGSFYPSNGMTDQLIYIVSAEYNGGSERVQKGETTEIIWLSRKEILQLIHDNVIKDGVTLTALMFQYSKQY